MIFNLINHLVTIYHLFAEKNSEELFTAEDSDHSANSLLLESETSAGDGDIDSDSDSDNTISLIENLRENPHTKIVSFDDSPMICTIPSIQSDESSTETPKTGYAAPKRKSSRHIIPQQSPIPPTSKSTKTHINQTRTPAAPQSIIPALAPRRNPPRRPRSVHHKFR